MVPVKIKRWFGIAILSCVPLSPCDVTAQTPQVKRLTAVEAKDHIGEKATVCGRVASTRYAATTRGKPTFLNLDKPYPNLVFTVLIWGMNREKFGAPEEQYRGKQICVTGTITEYRKAPEIAVSDPQSIELQK
jgi:DNA/RNA endonuclease YhcR with UshA esterase domain